MRRAWVLACLLAVGCAGGGDGNRAARPSPTPDAPRAAACTFPWSRDLPAVGRDDLRLGPIVLRGLRDPHARWWHEPAEVVARHLRAGDHPEYSRSVARELASDAIANGRRRYVARDVLVDVPAFTAVTISVPSDDINAAILPNGVQRFGGFVPRDGVKRVRCATEAQSSFHLGFVVAGARCVPLTVESARRRISHPVGFGVDDCR